MKERIQRGLALLLVCCMCLSPLSGYALAEETETPSADQTQEAGVPGGSGKPDDALTPEPDKDGSDAENGLPPEAGTESGKTDDKQDLPPDGLVLLMDGDGMEYEVYPTPHEILYAPDGAAVRLPEELNAVFESGVDDYTKNRAREALSGAGMTYAEGNAVNADGNLLVGIYGSGGVVDQYFTEQGWTDAQLFAKTDSYLLAVGAAGISVLGRDTDAAFYGLTTLKRVLEQVSGRTVNCFTVKDYADVPLRGFIEGYYGNPWSNEDRAELMRFGGELKMNAYFYAPKDDPKHNAQWRELYTEEELERIRELAQAGEESKCRYVFALHPFMNYDHYLRFDDHYAADLEVLKAKFLQVIDIAGVRQIAVLADDVTSHPGPTAAQGVRLMTDLTDWLESAEMQNAYPGLKTSIPYVPGDYMGNGSGSEIQGLSAAPVAGGQSGGLPNSVPMVMTCGAVWGHVTDSFLSTFYNNTGRNPFLWVNWPCSDNGHSYLVMGGFDTVLNPGVDPTKIEGIMLNPMQQSEPSEVAIFGNADYAWHIWPDKAAADKAWYDSFKYVDHMSYEETDTSEALRELSKHMIYENIHNPFPESVDLKPALDAFRAKLDAGASVAADIPALKAEFQKLSDAADLYLSDGRERLAEQIQYWLWSWQDVTAANLALLDALLEIETGDGGDASNSRILSCYTDAQARYAQSKTYGFLYVDYTEYAVVGSRVIQPFTQAILSKVAETARTILDPTVLIATPITSRTDTPEGALGNMIDGKESTETLFKNPNSIALGEYVGVRYNHAVPVTAVRFLMGRSGNLSDTFTQCKLQYTENGSDWLDIPDAAFSGTPAVLEKTGLSLNAVGIRAIATAAKEGTWFGVREIYVNELPNTAASAFLSSNIAVAPSGGALDNILDGDTATKAMFARSPYSGSLKDKVPAGAYVGVDLGAEQILSRITVKGDSAVPGDRMVNAVLEYSTDSVNYLPIQSNINADVDIDVSGQNISARYVRLRNGDAETGGWVRISEFSVQKLDADTPVANTLIRTDRWTVSQNSGPESKLFDGDDSTFLWYDTGDADDTLAGDYIGVDLGREAPIGKVHFAVGYDNGDKWTEYDMEYSIDAVNWTKHKSYVGAASGQDIIDEDFGGQITARYVRLINTKQLHAWVKFGELRVRQYDSRVYHLDKSGSAVVTGLSGTLSDDTATLAAVSVTLAPGEYVGIVLPRIRELTDITADYAAAAGVTLEAGCSKAEMETLALPLREALDARYVRLRNTGDTEATFALADLTVRSNEVFAPNFDSATMGGAANSEDARKLGTTGNIFDGDLNTSCKFCATQVKDQYVLYDLGQTRSISKLELIVYDSQLDYVRNGKVQIATDKAGPWTDVITIASDVTVADADTSAGKTGLWGAVPNHPNYVEKAGTIPAQDARYVRIVFTDNFSGRWLMINELMVNDGEYIPEAIPVFVADPPEGSANATPSKLIDGDMTTGFTPDMTGRTSGSLTYRLSDLTKVKQFNLLQSGGAVSDAVVEVRPVGGGAWTRVGVLDGAFKSLYTWSFPEGVAELRITWGDVAPTFYELITVPFVGTLAAAALRAKLSALPVISHEDEGLYDPDRLAAYRAARTAAEDLLFGDPTGLTQADLDGAESALQDAYDLLNKEPDSDLEPPTAPTGLKLAPDGRAVTWTASTDDIGVTGYTVVLDGGLAQTVIACSFALPELASGSTHTVTVTAHDGSGKTSAAATLTFTMPELISASGRVIRSGGAPVSGAQIRLYEGARTLATATSGGDGAYTLVPVAPGSYLLAVTVDETTLTSLVQLSAGDKTIVTRLPDGNLGSSVTVEDAPELPIILAGGLNELFTAEDSALVQENPSYGISYDLAVGAAKEAVEINSIKARAGTRELGPMLDVTLTKTVTTGEIETTVITSAGQFLTLILRPHGGWQSEQFSVMRCHGGAVDVLTNTPNSDGEYFERLGAQLTLHVRKFSTYAVVYGEEPVTPPSGGSGSSVRQYTVTASALGGTVSPELAAVSAGRSQKFTLVPREGFLLRSLLLDGAAVELPQADADGSYTYTLKDIRAAHTVKAVFGISVDDLLAPYTDLSGHWARESIAFTVEKGLMTGVSKDSFQPDGSASRAMAAAILYRMAGSPSVSGKSSFTDVPDGAWYSDAVAWASGLGIIKGDGGRFSPERDVTRQELAAFLMRCAETFAQNVTVDTDVLSAFTDSAEIAPWARDAMAWCVEQGIFVGNDAKLSPSGVATRAELATTLRRFFEKD